MASAISCATEFAYFDLRSFISWQKLKSAFLTPIPVADGHSENVYAGAAMKGAIENPLKKSFELYQCDIYKPINIY